MKDYTTTTTPATREEAVAMWKTLAEISGITNGELYWFVVDAVRNYGNPVFIARPGLVYVKYHRWDNWFRKI